MDVFTAHVQVRLVMSAKLLSNSNVMMERRDDVHMKGVQMCVRDVMHVSVGHICLDTKYTTCLWHQSFKL